MLAFFERLLDPFPAPLPDVPPRGLFAFIWHYARPIRLHLFIAAVTAALFGAVEAALFGFLGKLVDFIAETDRASFWADHRWWLIGVGFLILVLLPLLSFLHDAVTNQSCGEALESCCRTLICSRARLQAISVSETMRPPPNGWSRWRGT